ncbi:MAG: 1-acyl-sn-glycerol-3-phosphate acyltransferase [Bacteroidales bacterium]|nr:1-acyl-sn-glycerol-3-phosphate acyltransferase [Bacteroidales bacterium]
MKPKTAKFILEKVLGWTGVQNKPEEPKCIIMGVPHTSILDFVITFFYYRSLGGHPKVLIKAKFFVGPLGWLLRRCGALPLKNDKGAAAVLEMVHAFEKYPEIQFCFAPEGTRAAVKRWKTGFHTIAKAANVPVYLGYFDYKHKVISCGERFELTDDAHADMIRMQKEYKKLPIYGYHPERIAFMDEVENQQ